MNSKPCRIVSLLSSATEMLFAIGAGDRVVGIGHECDWPAAALDRPRMTRSWIDSAQPSDVIDQQVRARMAAGLPLYEVDAELLEQLAPDLIVTQAQCDVCAVRYEEVMGIIDRSPTLRGTQVVPLAPVTLEDIFDDILRVGQAAHTVVDAEAFVSTLRSRVEQVRQQVASAPRLRTVCIEWVKPLMLAANWTPTLIELAGGEAGLVTANAHSSYAQWEEVVAYDPEVIVISPCGFDLERSRREAEVLRGWPNWNSLTAVREGRVYLVDGNAYLNRSGPRIVDSLEILAHAIQPERRHASAHPGWMQW